MSDRIPINAKRIEWARVRQALQALGLDDPSMIESVTIDPQHVTVNLIRPDRKGAMIWRSEDVYYVDRSKGADQ